MSDNVTRKSVTWYLAHPSEIFVFLQRRCNFKVLPDKAFLQIKYKLRFGQKLDWKNPHTFNEKLQWLKIHDRKPIYTTMVDKCEAKKYIADRIGEEYVIPTYGVWERFDDINFDTLPDQFVLKCTHDCGGLVIVKDKNDFDREEARKKVNKSLKRNYYYNSREWPYKNVQPRIIAEKYVEDTADDALTDYKFFCFHGIPRIMYISKDHGRDPRTDFFDMEFKHLPIKARDPNAEVIPPKPEQFEKMKQIAGILSEGIPHLRVDFYLINGEIFVGELTFYHMGGFIKVQPQEWNERMGSWIECP